MLSNFLCVARNLEKKKFVSRDKNDQIFTTVYIYRATFYGFHMLSKCAQSH